MCCYRFINSEGSKLNNWQICQPCFYHNTKRASTLSVLGSQVGNNIWWRWLTPTGVLRTRWLGIFSAIRLVSIMQRYAKVPLHTGSAFGIWPDSVEWLSATNFFRTIDFIPSTPMRRSHVAVFPFSNTSRIEPPDSGISSYETRRLDKWQRIDAERWFKRISCITARCR